MGNAARHLASFQFRPGQSGNPTGKAKLPEYLRAIKALTQAEACLLISKYGRMTRAQLDVVVKDPNTPMIELSIASIFANAVKHGCTQRLNFLLDRAIGATPKAPDNPQEIALRQELEQLSNEQLLKIIKEDPPAELKRDA